MSPVAETWQVPFTESAVKDLFQIKLGIRAAKITKIFNGYVYITANYWSIFFPLGLIKTIFGICKGIKTAKSEWSQKALEHAKDVAESKKADLKNLSLHELFELCNTVFQKEAEYVALNLYVGIYCFGFEYALRWLLPIFVKKCRGVDYKDLLTGFYNKSIEANVELWKSIDINAWLATYGHQVQDLDVYLPTLQDAPEAAVSLKHQLQQNSENPEEKFAATAQRRQETEEQVLANIRKWIPFGRKIFFKLLRVLQSYVSIREDRPFYYQGQAVARKILLEFGTRLVRDEKLDSAADIFFLTREEISDLADQKELFSKSIVFERKSLRQSQKDQIPPANIKEPFLGEFPSKNFSVNEKTEISGIGASKGKRVGRARIIISQADFYKFQSGEILVVESTNPSFAPLLALASGVVTDKGGALCHAAIVSRELGIPAVVGTESATVIFKDGDYVMIDGDAGVAKKVDQNFALAKI